MTRLISPIKRLFRPALVFFMLIFIVSCFQEDIYEGVYKAEGGKSQRYCSSQIELMEKGVAVWRVPDDEVPFRWDVKDEEIWLSSKSGGIIIGKIQEDTIHVKLPGIKTVCHFKKVPMD